MGLINIFSNQVVFATLFAWLVSQAIKMAYLSAIKENFNFKDIWESERMPSSHSALVTALAVSIFMIEGASTLFAIALVVALIVIRDAVGVRKKVGEHAKLMNKVFKKNLSEQEGHTYIEAIAGMLVGGLSAAYVILTGFTFFSFLQVIYFMLPGILANVAPVIVRKIPFDKPINSELFGKNKTWRGFLAGVLIALLVVIIQGELYKSSFRSLSIINYSAINLPLAGIILGLGIMLGDLIKSYFKRRAGIKEGKNFFPWDQMDSLIGGLLAISIFVLPSWPVIPIMVMLTFMLSAILNALKVDLKL